ncbi:unnamed protein product [Owenia fusiformis]|uniref:SnoaL-like domain-containing protein n=1 Tax=Owenia fusiformis TaxID=6347 RepID=A0A8S4P1Q9_OWEFU|nr:unnamed protein product [Owenia fusiformis]
MAGFKLVIFVILISKMPFFGDAVKDKRVKAIVNRLIQFDDYFNAGKFDDIVEMWTDDGILLPNDGNITIGKAAITKYYDGFSGKGLRIVSVTHTVFGRGSFLSAFGECDIFNPDGSLYIHIRDFDVEVYALRFIMNFMRIGKEWMMRGNVDNTGPRE